MELDTYLESVRRSVQNATALADEQTRSVAERLGATLDDAGRLALITALSDAAAEISRDLSPGSVELRMSGTRPEFVVTPAPSQLTGADDEDHDDDDDTATGEATEELAPDADEPTVRITLRLPASLKAKVDQAAAAEGLSANAWLMGVVHAVLSGRHRPPRPPRPPRGPVFGPEGVLGPDGPFGPDGVFGPEGVLGPDGPFGPEGVFGQRGERGERGDRGERGERGGRGGRGRGRGPRRGSRGHGSGQRMTGWAQ